MDADGSLDPRQLPRVSDPVRLGRAELCLGRATGGGPARGRGTRGWPTGCWPPSCAAAAVSSSPISARCAPPAASRCWRSGCATGRFGWPLEMVLRAAAAGWRVSEVPGRLPRARRRALEGQRERAGNRAGRAGHGRAAHLSAIARRAHARGAGRARGCRCGPPLAGAGLASVVVGAWWIAAGHGRRDRAGSSCRRRSTPPGSRGRCAASPAELSAASLGMAPGAAAVRLPGRARRGAGRRIAGGADGGRARGAGVHARSVAGLERRVRLHRLRAGARAPRAQPVRLGARPRCTATRSSRSSTGATSRARTGRCSRCSATPLGMDRAERRAVGPQGAGGDRRSAAQLAGRGRGPGPRAGPGPGGDVRRSEPGAARVRGQRGPQRSARRGRCSRGRCGCSSADASEARGRRWWPPRGSS